MIDLVYLVDPPPPVAVLQLQHLGGRPMEVVGDICYLLEELVEGIARYPPNSLIFTSTSVPQVGQATLTVSLPSMLMRR